MAVFQREAAFNKADGQAFGFALSEVLGQWDFAE